MYFLTPVQNHLALIKGTHPDSDSDSDSDGYGGGGGDSVHGCAIL